MTIDKLHFTIRKRLLYWFKEGWKIYLDHIIWIFFWTKCGKVQAIVQAVWMPKWKLKIKRGSLAGYNLSIWGLLTHRSLTGPLGPGNELHSEKKKKINRDEILFDRNIISTNGYLKQSCWKRVMYPCGWCDNKLGGQHREKKSIIFFEITGEKERIYQYSINGQDLFLN